MGLVMNDATLEAVDRLRPIAEEPGLSMAELALAWVLRRPELASAIIGASRPEQVHANAKASGIELTPDTLTAIDEALGDAPVREPTLGADRAVRGHPPLKIMGSLGLQPQRSHDHDTGSGLLVIRGADGAEDATATGRSVRDQTNGVAIQHHSSDHEARPRRKLRGGWGSISIQRRWPSTTASVSVAPLGRRSSRAAPRRAGLGRGSGSGDSSIDRCHNGPPSLSCAIAASKAPSRSVGTCIRVAA